MRVFITYAYEDRTKVKQLYNMLQSEGFDAWLDSERVLPGQDWELEIRKAIESSDAIVICLTTNAIQKAGYVQKELRLALSVAEERPEGTIFIIPVRLDDSPIPHSLRHWQFIDLFSEVGATKLIKSLKLRAKQLGLGESQIQEVIKQDKKPKKHVFIAMPFNSNMEDTYYYGIQRAVDTAGFDCYRSDKVAFVGDIMQELKKELEKSVAVIAELTDSNPNVYLEVGFAWGKDKPTVLIIKQGDKPRFDVQGQKCLMYNNIKHLEEILTKELLELKASGVIQ